MSIEFAKYFLALFIAIFRSARLMYYSKSILKVIDTNDNFIDRKLNFAGFIDARELCSPLLPRMPTHQKISALTKTSARLPAFLWHLYSPISFQQIQQPIHRKKALRHHISALSSNCLRRQQTPTSLLDEREKDLLKIVCILRK